MNLDEVLSELFSLTRSGIKLGLERVRLLLGSQGNPQERFPSIHIAGTNGKGSTAAILASILRAAGLRVGLYTSPHLSSFSERIVVDGRPIPEGEIVRLYLDVKEASGLGRGAPDGEGPTFFEMTTALAFCHFAESNVDVAVVETGLGGRLDATNVLSPAVTVITTISRDHEAHLGCTIPAIAREKAGIIKPGVPVVVGAVPREALDVIEETAQALGSPLVRLGREFQVEEVRLDAAEGSFDWIGRKARYGGLTVPLAGAHQVHNAALALAAATEADRRTCGEWRVDGRAIRRGLVEARWPGRFEIVSREPLIVIDGAHNPEGVRALVETLALLPAPREKAGTLVFGTLADKDAGGMLEIVCPSFDRVVLVRPESDRSADPHDLAGLVPPGPTVWIRDNVEAAVAELMDESGPRDRIVVAGSLYLVAKARASFRMGGVQPVPVS